ncbi:hypothetical protein M2397_000544 [Pseudomonas sp. BIGb0381]|nr:hypothetical protein [Pseudomonas sp. BIGb0381]
MPSATRLSCVTVLLPMVSGCQSFSPRIQPEAATCLPPPAPAAWFMQPVEPNLTRRMLNEFSPSPVTVTKD